MTALPVSLFRLAEYTPMTSRSPLLSLLSLLLLLGPTAIHAFFAPAAPAAHRTSTMLHAWSLPTTEAFLKKGSSWYNEYNPTARQTVYEE